MNRPFSIRPGHRRVLQSSGARELRRLAPFGPQVTARPIRIGHAPVSSTKVYLFARAQVKRGRLILGCVQIRSKDNAEPPGLCPRRLIVIRLGGRARFLQSYTSMDGSELRDIPYCGAPGAAHPAQFKPLPNSAPSSGNCVDNPVVIIRRTFFESPKLILLDQARRGDCRPNVPNAPKAEQPGRRRGQRPAAAAPHFPPLLVPSLVIIHELSA